MPFYQIASLQYYAFESLEGHPITQAIFTRHGGRSPAPWASLNVGGTVGDRAERVAQNCRMVFDALSRSPDSSFELWQVHGSEVVIADEPRQAFENLPRADAVLTDNPRVTLFMRFADCVPILLSDRNRGVVGLVHAGWQGTLEKTVAAAVATMAKRYGSRPAQISAGIGPSIGPDHYEVGPDVVAAARRVFGENAPEVLPAVDGKTHFDLWQANQLLLEAAGVGQIEVAGVCTGCHLEDWYSHRLERGKTGRFGAVIALQD